MHDVSHIPCSGEQNVPTLAKLEVIFPLATEYVSVVAYTHHAKNNNTERHWG